MLEIQRESAKKAKVQLDTDYTNTKGNNRLD